MKAVIIVGSARKQGETGQVAAELQRMSNWEVIDLADFQITHFDYEHKNRDDDFISLMKSIAEQYDILIFATPVYWYSMSGRMKIFFDRLTDLLKIEKATGRQLRQKYMAVISSSNGDNLGDHFWLPFQKTAAYLGMHYITGLHTIQGQLNQEQLIAFRREIEEVVSGS